MKRVFIAGATGYLGRYLCSVYRARGWHVTALVRKKTSGGDLEADVCIQAEATRPETLKGAMARADLVVSALGITRHADGVGYWDVDYQANVNLLEEALRSGVQHFAYVHVLHADRMGGVSLVAAKSAFVRKLQVAPLSSTIIAPSGYFSDMADVFTMAQAGRVWLFGNGHLRMNPIHGADLANAIFDAVARAETWLDVGGPQTFSQTELATLCFEALGTQPRVTYLPDILRRALLRLVPLLAPRRIAGPVQFFLTASAMNMTAPAFGDHLLGDHFASLVRQSTAD